MLLGILLILAATVALRGFLLRRHLWAARRIHRWSVFAAILCVAGLIIIASIPGLLPYMTIDRFNLDANHFWIALSILAVSLWVLTLGKADEKRSLFVHRLIGVQYFSAAIVVICGVLMVLRTSWIEWLSRFPYTEFDAGLVLLTAASVVMAALLVVSRAEGRSVEMSQSLSSGAH